MDNLFWNRFYNMCTLKGTKPNPVAKEINISSGIVTKWKTAGTLPNGETLIKIADYLDCSVDYLLGRTDKLTTESNEHALKNVKFIGKDGTVKFKKISSEMIAMLEQLPDSDDKL